MMRLMISLAGLCVLSVSVFAQRVEIVWPTPSTAYFEGKPLETFIQPTASGVLESGLFGCTRSGGAQFHEGIDIKPVKRNRQGEAVDPVFAAMSGVVRHISRQAGNSSYGRYIVIEHPDQLPGVFTLYAHLASIAPGLSVGAKVERGQEIAVMGRSASGYAIPKDRAHLHFEIGVMLTRDFQGWYNFKKFGSRNEHGLWNGMNLIGIDPLDFFDQLRARRVETFQQYFAQLKPAVKVRVATRRVPDFIERYPALLAKPMPTDSLVAGWEVAFNEMGVPFAWTPLTAMELIGMGTNEVRVVASDEGILKKNRCRSLVFMKRGKPAIGKDLETVLQLVFGLREEL
ncbi:M23 family metallopeptidase [Nibricoccus aquaticus]|nr:M23 family metallopeptidase [Nibricoccus aquaticus]